MIPVETMLAQVAEQAVQLQTGGLIVMSASILLVVSLCTFCFYRIMRKQPEQR